MDSESGLSLTDLADKLGAEIANPPSGRLAISGLAALADAGAADLSFFHHDRYIDDLKTTKAAAVLVARDFTEEVTHVPLLKVDSPSLAFDQATRELLGEPLAKPAPGIHPSAVVADDVEMDAGSVGIGPNAVVGAGSKLGRGCNIGPGAVIGPDCQLGSDCTIHSNATLYDRTILGERVIIHSGTVLGSDGFGFELKGGKHVKIEHFGHVEIGSDVEIGSNCSVDRGRFGATSIGDGTKIDNLVQIGHNVTMGKHCIIVADTAMAGSSNIGDYVTMAAQVGVAGHIEVGPFSVLLARAGVTKSVEGGTPEQPAYYAGFPAGPASRMRKEMVAPRKVPDILKRLRALEKKLEE